MNQIERVQACLQGRPTDRVPVFVMSRHHAMRLAGVSFRQCLADGSGHTYAEAQLAAWRRYGYDGLMDLEGVNAEAEIMGCRLAFSEDASPTVVAPLVTDVAQVVDLDIPDMTAHPVMRRQLNVVRRLRDLAGPQAPIYANVQCPLRLAAMLRGIESLMLDFYEHPEQVHGLLDVATRVAVRYGLALAQAGAQILMPSNPLGARNLISRDHYAAFVAPYDARMVAAFASAGVPALLHICGDVSDRLDIVADCGYAGVSLDSAVDLAAAKASVGDRLCLAGNVDVLRPLRSGTPEEVRVAADRCLQAAAAGGGFMLAPGCEVVADTPPANLHALVGAAVGQRCP